MLLCHLGPYDNERLFISYTNALILQVTRKQPGEGKMDYHHDKPFFYTIIMEGFNTKLMKIPPKFLKHLDEDFSSKAILTGPSDDQWQVTIFKKRNDIYMQNGWQQFLTDNSAMLNELLLFTYHGKNCFRVQIFSWNGCERLYLKETRQEETATPSFVRTKKSRQRNISAGSSHLHESKSCQEDLPFSNERSLPKDFPKPQISTIIERTEACKLLESSTSGNPHFKHIMTKSNVENRCLLPITTTFARKYIPEAVKMIILRNSEGKQWEVTVTCVGCQSKRYTQLTKGWQKFVHDNKLRRGDTCTFELEDGNHMRVQILRCAPQ